MQFHLRCGEIRIIPIPPSHLPHFCPVSCALIAPPATCHMPHAGLIITGMKYDKQQIARVITSNGLKIFHLLSWQRVTSLEHSLLEGRVLEGRGLGNEGKILHTLTERKALANELQPILTLIQKRVAKNYILKKSFPFF